MGSGCVGEDVGEMSMAVGVMGAAAPRSGEINMRSGLQIWIGKETRTQ
jgi:hypothetical protein